MPFPRVESGESIRKAAGVIPGGGIYLELWLIEHIATVLPK